MATRRRRPSEQAHNGVPHATSTPSQEDEADILQEVGGERDEGGELLVDEETVRDIGAVDAESVRENRRMRHAQNKKQGGLKGVVFNTDDLLTKYESLIKEWPPNTLDISVKRLTGGSDVTRTILSRPRSGAELYEALRVMHGPNEEAQYGVKFLDTQLRVYRGTGRITMPDARPAGQQGQQPMYNPNGAPPPGYSPQQQPWQTQPQQAPPVAQAVNPQAPFDPMAMMSQMFDMFQKMSQRVQPPAPIPTIMPSMQPQVAPTDPAAMMQQMFDMFLKMQGLPAASMPAPQPVVVAAPAPQPAPQPSIDPMAMMKQMFEMFRDMQASLTPRPSPMQRPAYGPQDGRPPYARPYSEQQQPPPQRQLTASEQFRASLANVREAVGVVEEMRSLLPEDRRQEAFDSEDDDSPFRVIDTGAAKLVVNKTDGSTRIWETGLANMPEIFKWVGEQRKEIQEEARQRRQQQAPAPQRQLAPGYVEVRPGVRPPPGYVFVPVEQEQEQEQGLPPPPSDVPPPIQEPPPPVRPAWGAPTIPDEEGENQ